MKVFSCFLWIIFFVLGQVGSVGALPVDYSFDVYVTDHVYGEEGAEVFQRYPIGSYWDFTLRIDYDKRTDIPSGTGGFFQIPAEYVSGSLFQFGASSSILIEPYDDWVMTNIIVDGDAGQLFMDTTAPIPYWYVGMPVGIPPYISGDGFVGIQVRVAQISPVPVPEPSTMLLSCFGLIGLAGFRKKWPR